MNENPFGEDKQTAGRTLREMIAKARGYVELFLEDLENEETVIEEPQEMLDHIMATLEYATAGGLG
jgi:predicted RNase H-like HicB family nuclease